MTPSQKTRVIPTSFGKYSHQMLTFDNGSTRFTILDETDDLSSQWLPLQGFQITESESHPGWRRRKYGSNTGDLGGEFFSSSRYAEDLEIDYSVSVSGAAPNGVIWASYRGPILPGGPFDMSFPPYANSEYQALMALGSTAIARCSPTNPMSGLTVALGELSGEGLPSLVGHTLSKLRAMSSAARRKSLSEEYLNYQFGWVPLVSDVQAFARAIASRDQVIAQFVRDSGKRVRRRYNFPPVRIVTSSSRGNTSPWTGPTSSPIYNNDLNTGTLNWIDTTEKNQWFSGAFTYYVPLGSDLRSRMLRQAQFARKLYGLSLTPDVFWNLAPWSWVIDWFSNAGDVIKNVAARELDGQVLAYGYVMEHTVSRRIYWYTGPTGFQTPAVYPSPVTLTSETKVRYKATPYGFGISWDGLSATQLAILTALGLNRAK